MSVNRIEKESITCLMNLLNDVGIHTISNSVLIRILKNDPELRISMLQMLFDCIQYIKHDILDKTVFKSLLDNFDIDLLCLFICEELHLLGYNCTEDELIKPIEVFHIIGYLLAQFVLDKIMRSAIFNRSYIQIDILKPCKTEKSIQSFDQNNIDALTILRHRLQGISKQMELLSTSVIKKDIRIRNSCSNIDTEILYLMKNETLLPQYVNELKEMNEHLKHLKSWLEQEAIFWDWFSSLPQHSIYMSIFPSERKKLQILDDCKSKLLQLESSSNTLDHLWSEVGKRSDMMKAEVLGEVNSKVFIDNAFVNLQCVPSIPSGPQHFISVDNKALQTMNQFNDKYIKKMKKLSKFTNALILDGSS